MLYIIYYISYIMYDILDIIHCTLYLISYILLPLYSDRAAIEQHQSGNRADPQKTCQSSAAAREPIGHSQSSQSYPGPQLSWANLSGFRPKVVSHGGILNCHRGISSLPTQPPDTHP